MPGRCLGIPERGEGFLRRSPRSRHHSQVGCSGPALDPGSGAPVWPALASGPPWHRARPGTGPAHLRRLPPCCQH